MKPVLPVLSLLIGLGVAFPYGQATELVTGEKSVVWEDAFDVFNPDHWTAQPSGLRLCQEPAPDGVTVQNGVLLVNGPNGVRLTSRQKFLYGTLEARVRITPLGAQYFGFMSRSPWGANALNLMSEAKVGWHLMLGSESAKGETPYAGFLTVPENQWYVIKLAWSRNRVALYLNGVLKSELVDDKRIPHTPMPLIIDTGAANVPMEIAWMRIAGGVPAGENLPAMQPPRLAAASALVELVSPEWRVIIDETTGLLRELYSQLPSPLLWTAPGAQGLDLYVRRYPDGLPVSFLRKGDTPATLTAKCFTSEMEPKDGEYAGCIKADFSVELVDNILLFKAGLTATKAIDHPVEIGLGAPFRPEAWQRQLFPRYPWLILHPQQRTPVRLPFLADPEDATVSAYTGNWIFYPMSILQRDDRSVIWGGLDVGRRLVLSPGNHGCVPAVTLAPKTWPKGKRLELAFVMRGLHGQDKEFPRALRWYLANCHSTDPLTKDIFPIRDWTPRTLPKGGGVGMPDLRITRANPKADLIFFDTVAEKFIKYKTPNLWITLNGAVDGSYPTAGQWVSSVGMPVSAVVLKSEVARIKAMGLRPCLYTFQFIIPELCKTGSKPDPSWVSYGADGQPSTWDIFKSGGTSNLGEWFTAELAGKLGTHTITWAYADYGNNAFRNWYVEQITASVDYYQLPGLSWDYSWSGMRPDGVYSRANPKTSYAHGVLRAQADISNWLRKHHPEAEIIVNDTGGSPSLFFANGVLMESTQMMSDLDFLAVKAMGRAMSSMNYFFDHNQGRWARQAMLDLARGCSLGLPFWVMMTPPESEYIANWTRFLDFSGRTTRLPALMDESAIACVADPGRLVGTVWSDGTAVMAAAFDRREAGNVENLRILMTIPNRDPAQAEWRISRLNRLNLEIASTGTAGLNWRMDKTVPGQLTISGPLGPGEMILVETN